jgi:hypothetical protein
MLGALLVSMVLGQLPEDVKHLQWEIKAIKDALVVKEADLQAKLAALPEKLGPVETLELVGYGQCEAQKIISGPKDVGLYRIVRQLTPPGDPYGFIAYLNSIRAQNGLQPVGYDPNLSMWAAENNKYGFGHNVMAARRQNAAAAISDINTLMSAWLASPGHASALLDPTITMAGIAYNGYVWTFNAN